MYFPTLSTRLAVLGVLGAFCARLKCDILRQFASLFPFFHSLICDLVCVLRGPGADCNRHSKLPPAKNALAGWIPLCQERFERKRRGKIKRGKHSVGRLDNIALDY